MSESKIRRKSKVYAATAEKYGKELGKVSVGRSCIRVKKIDDLNLEVLKATLQRLPTNPVEFTEEHLIDIEKLLDKIEDDDDVQQVFTNIT